ncbi:MAG TPA: flavin reductase family protein [Gammaproteobacteria bacterium]|nr:flavin reductase family protein [Gammaproteobacteria bacterium]
MQTYKISDLPKNLFKACITPRPIGWLSTVNPDGIPNLAPFSYFNVICDNPPMVMFSTMDSHIEGGPKDTLYNVEETGEFVVNVATFELREQVNLTSANLPRKQSEFEYSGLEYLPSILVKPFRVKNAPIQMECKYYQSIQLPVFSKDDINRMVIGTVELVHINPAILTDGFIDYDKFQPIARLGYNHYAVVTGKNIFKLDRPG